MNIVVLLSKKGKDSGGSGRVTNGPCEVGKLWKRDQIQKYISDRADAILDFGSVMKCSFPA